MFTKKFSDKHLRIGARTWRPRDREEIYRQRYLAVLEGDLAESGKPSEQKPSSVHHQPEAHHDPPPPSIHHQPARPRSRTTSLHQPSTSHSHHTQQPNPSLLSRSQSHKTHRPASQRRRSTTSESLNDAHILNQSGHSGAETNSQLGLNPTSHQAHDLYQSQNLPAAHSSLLSHPSGPSNHNLPHSSSIQQSRKEYAESCIGSELGKERLRKAQEGLQIAQERYYKALGIAQSNGSEFNHPLEFDHPEPGHMPDYSKTDYDHHTIRSKDAGLGHTSEHSNNVVDQVHEYNKPDEAADTPKYNNPVLNSRLEFNSTEPDDLLSRNELVRETQGQIELHETTLNQIQEQEQEQEQKLRQIRELEEVLAVREKEVAIREKQLEEALEVERLKYQALAQREKELEEALETERLRCEERIKLAQESADQAARESIQREEERQRQREEEYQRQREEEYQRKREEIQKDFEEKQRLARQEYEAKYSKRFEEAQLQLEAERNQLEAERKEEKRKETEAQMLAEMEKDNLEKQRRLDLLEQTSAQEKERMAMRARIQERDNGFRKPLGHPNRNIAELIATFQPPVMRDFDPTSFRNPCASPILDYYPPSCPPTPMSLHIVPEAVKKVAIIHKEYHDKLNPQPHKHPTEEQSKQMTFKHRHPQDQVSAHFKAEKGFGHQHTTTNQFGHDHQSPSHWGSGSLGRQDGLPNVHGPLTQSARSWHLNNPIPSSERGSQHQSTGKARSNQQHHNHPAETRGNELERTEAPARSQKRSLHSNYAIPSSDLESQPQSTTKANSSQQHGNPQFPPGANALDLIQAFAQREQDFRRKEDALLAEARRLKEVARAMTPRKVKLPDREMEDSSEAQNRGAEAAAYFMAEQASSKPPRCKTPQKHVTTSNPRAPLHNDYSLNTSAISSAPPFEHVSTPGTTFQVYSTDHVPGYNHEVLKDIESSVVLLVAHPSPIDYLENDPRGRLYRHQNDELARHALVTTARNLGADAIICLSHRSPVLVENRLVNFSAKGIAVTLKNPPVAARAGLDNHNTQAPHLNAQSHPSHPERHQQAYEQQVPGSPNPSEPFDNPALRPGHDLQATFKENRKSKKSNNTAARHGLEPSSIETPTIPKDSDGQPANHHHRRDPRHHRVLEEQKFVILPETQSGLPKPPGFMTPSKGFMTPKVVLQSPSEHSSANEPKEDTHIHHLHHSGKSSSTSTHPPVKTNARSSREAKTNTHAFKGQGASSSSSSGKPPVKIPFGIPANDDSWGAPASTVNPRSISRMTSQWDEQASSADFESISRVTNTDRFEEIESETHTHHSSPVPHIYRQPFGALSTIAESDQSMEKRTARPSHISHAETASPRSSLSSPCIEGLFPDYDEQLDSHFSGLPLERMNQQEQGRGPPHSPLMKHGKSHSSVDVHRAKERVINKERTGGSKAQKHALTKNSICSNSPPLNPPGSFPSPRQNQEDLNQFTNVTHSSPLANETMQSFSSQKSQEGGIQKEKVYPNNKKRGNKPVTVETHPNPQSSTSSQETVMKGCVTSSTSDPVTSTESHDMAEKAQKGSSRAPSNKNQRHKAAPAKQPQHSTTSSEQTVSNPKSDAPSSVEAKTTPGEVMNRSDPLSSSNDHCTQSEASTVVRKGKKASSRGLNEINRHNNRKNEDTMGNSVRSSTSSQHTAQGTSPMVENTDSGANMTNSAPDYAHPSESSTEVDKGKKASSRGMKEKRRPNLPDAAGTIENSTGSSSAQQTARERSSIAENDKNPSENVLSSLAADPVPPAESSSAVPAKNKKGPSRPLNEKNQGNCPNTSDVTESSLPASTSHKRAPVAEPSSVTTKSNSSKHDSSVTTKSNSSKHDLPTSTNENATQSQSSTTTENHKKGSSRSRNEKNRPNNPDTAETTKDPTQPSTSAQSIVEETFFITEDANPSKSDLPNSENTNVTQSESSGKAEKGKRGSSRAQNEKNRHSDRNKTGTTKNPTRSSTSSQPTSQEAMSLAGKADPSGHDLPSSTSNNAPQSESSAPVEKNKEGSSRSLNEKNQHNKPNKAAAMQSSVQSSTSSQQTVQEIISSASQVNTTEQGLPSSVNENVTQSESSTMLEKGKNRAQNEKKNQRKNLNKADKIERSSTSSQQTAQETPLIGAKPNSGETDLPSSANAQAGPSESSSGKKGKKTSAQAPNEKNRRKNPNQADLLDRSVVSSQSSAQAESHPEHDRNPREALLEDDPMQSLVLLKKMVPEMASIYGQEIGRESLYMPKNYDDGSFPPYDWNSGGSYAGLDFNFDSLSEGITIAAPIMPSPARNLRYSPVKAIKDHAEDAKESDDTETEMWDMFNL